MSTERSAVTGTLPRRNVFSAMIKNQTSDKVHCCIEYHTLSGTDNEITEFNINSNEEQKCEEKVHATPTHSTKSTSSNVFPKVINSIQVRKSDGSSLQITAPFDNVPHEDVHNWKFTIDNDKIHSEKN